MIKQAIINKKQNEINTAGCLLGIKKASWKAGLVPRTGIEPVTPPWKGGVLTPWPTRHFVYRSANIRAYFFSTKFLNYSLKVFFKFMKSFGIMRMDWTCFIVKTHSYWIETLFHWFSNQHIEPLSNKYEWFEISSHF